MIIGSAISWSLVNCTRRKPLSKNEFTTAFTPEDLPVPLAPTKSTLLAGLPSTNCQCHYLSTAVFAVHNR